MTIDLNFYPEQHMDELEGMADLEVPAGWTVGQLIQELRNAKCDLWKELLHVDDDGNESWW